MNEIQNLNKKIDFNNLIYHFKGKSGPNNFISFKGPLAFHRNIKNGYITLERAEKTKTKKKSNQV